MSDDINECMFTGRLAADPEVRINTDKTLFVTFRLASNKEYKDRNSGEKKQATEWISMFWTLPAGSKVVDYLRQGREVFVKGEFTTRKKAGTNGEKDSYFTSIKVSYLKLLGSGNAPSRDRQPASTGGYEFEDDLPR